MEIRLAKTAGFCFGVDRAVQMTRRLLDAGEKVATLGPLIHNPQVVAELEARGAKVAASPAGGAAGVQGGHPQPRGAPQRLRRAGGPGHPLGRRHLPLRGQDPRHRPAGRTGGRVPGCGGRRGPPGGAGDRRPHRGESLCSLTWRNCGPGKGLKIPKKRIFAVAQTTFQATKWQECSEFLKKAYTNAEIFDTICNATWARQQEAEDLSRQCDLVVVIGGHHSSNTQKLVAVAAKHTRAVTV